MNKREALNLFKNTDHLMAELVDIRTEFDNEPDRRREGADLISEHITTAIDALDLALEEILKQYKIELTDVA